MPFIRTTTNVKITDTHALLQVLAQDPRPSYQDDPARIYGMEFAGFEVRFRVDSNTLIVEDIITKC